MSRDSSGNYNLPLAPVVPGTTIESAWANTTLDDIKVALTDSLSRSGKGGMLVSFTITDGTNNNPGIGFVNEPSTGLYRSGTNEMRVTVGGADMFRYSTANGVQIRTGGAWYDVLSSADAVGGLPEGTGDGNMLRWENGAGAWQETGTIVVTDGGTVAITGSLTINGLPVSTSDLPDGNTSDDTLRWNGAAWVPSSALSVNVNTVVTAAALRVDSGTTLVGDVSAEGALDVVGDLTFGTLEGSAYHALPAGTANNQSLRWNSTATAWQSSSTLTIDEGATTVNVQGSLTVNGLPVASSDLPDGNTSGDTLVWNGAAWLATGDLDVTSGVVTAANMRVDGLTMLAADTAVDGNLAIGPGISAGQAMLHVETSPLGVGYAPPAADVAAMFETNGVCEIVMASADNAHSRISFRSETTNSSSEDGSIRYYPSTGANNAGQMIMFAGDGGALRIDGGAVTPYGDSTHTSGSAQYPWSEVFASVGTINTSDRRKKKNIHGIEHAEALIMALTPVTYEWESGDSNRVHMGLIAQDVGFALDHLGIDATRSGLYRNDKAHDTYGLNYTELVAPLIDVVQDLRRELDEIKALLNI